MSCRGPWVQIPALALLAQNLIRAEEGVKDKWIITGDTIFTNTTIYLDKDLWMKDGGRLYLSNVTVLVNNTQEVYVDGPIDIVIGLDSTFIAENSTFKSNIGFKRWNVISVSDNVSCHPIIVNNTIMYNKDGITHWAQL